MSKAYNIIFHETSGFKKKTVLSNIKITPDLAAELLQLNKNNRPVSDKVVKEYARQMTNKKWEFNGDTIRFSETGALLDGQHRLKAVVESNTTQIFNLQSGLKDEVFDVIDIGKGRTASDAVAIAGYENHSTIATAVKLVMAYERSKIKNALVGGGSGREKFTNADVIDYIETFLDVELMQECAKLGGKCVYKARFYSAPTYAAFCYIFGKIDRDSAFLFFELLASGENISKTSYSMVYLLRQRLIKQQSQSTMIQTVDKYALLIKSWNYFRKGKEIVQLQWQPHEEFPIAE